MSRTILRFAVLSLVLIALVVLAACAPAPTPVPPTAPPPTVPKPTETPTVIEFTILSNFTPDVARGKVLATLIDEFNKKYAGRIKVNSNLEPDWPAMQQKIRALISAGTPPDLFLYNYNANDLSRERSGQLMNWAPYLDADPAWKSRIRAENLAALTINGEIVGIPSDQAPVLAYYHSDLFEKAGIKSFPKTWDEFFEACEKLKETGVACIGLMTADDAWHAMNAFTYVGASAGGENTFAVGQSLDSPGVVKAAELLKRMFEYSTPDAVGANYAVSSRNFLTKKVAMIIDGPWLISSIQSDVEDPCKVMVATSPTLADTKVPAGFIVTDSMNPWAAAKQPTKEREQAIVEWMKFFTSEDNVKRMSIEGEYPLAVKATFTDKDKAKANCQMAQVLDIFSKAPMTVVEVVRNIKPAAFAELPGLLESLALDKISPEEFATQLQGFSE